MMLLRECRQHAVRTVCPFPGACLTQPRRQGAADEEKEMENESWTKASRDNDNSVNGGRAYLGEGL